ncbi:MAG: OmpH family outer membrane protein [Nitrospirota bacterium]
MKKVIVFMVLFSSWIFSAYGADFKVGYVDLSKTLNESEEGKKATKLLEEMVISKQAVLAEKEGEIKKLKEELEKQKQSPMFTADAMKDKEANLNKLVRDLQIKVNDYQEEVQKKEAEFRTEIIKGLRAIINSYGEKEDFTIIFESRESGMLYAQKKIDITDEILKKYNEASKTKK